MAQWAPCRASRSSWPPTTGAASCRFPSGAFWVRPSLISNCLWSVTAARTTPSASSPPLATHASAGSICQRNSGHQSAPNNEGLRLATGEVIAYLGHDDLWLPHHLEACVRALDENASDLAYTLVACVGPEGRFVWPSIPRPERGHVFAAVRDDAPTPGDGSGSADGETTASCAAPRRSSSGARQPGPVAGSCSFRG